MLSGPSSLILSVATWNAVRADQGIVSVSDAVPIYRSTVSAPCGAYLNYATMFLTLAMMIRRAMRRGIAT